MQKPPRLVVITDYPDDTIMNNLRENVARNRPHVSEECETHCLGYEWGKDITPLLYASTPQPWIAIVLILSLRSLVPDEQGYDIVILSDLLHFDSSHDVLISSLTSLLRKSATARTYVAAGKYTLPHVCDHFLREGEASGIVWEEGEDDPVWRGYLQVKGGGLDREQLGVRKGMCRWWIGRWGDSKLD